MLGLLPNGMEAGPQSPGKAPILPTKPPPSAPPAEVTQQLCGPKGLAGSWQP